MRVTAQITLILIKYALDDGCARDRTVYLKNCSTYAQKGNSIMTTNSEYLVYNGVIAVFNKTLSIVCLSLIFVAAHLNSKLFIAK